MLVALANGGTVKKDVTVVPEEWVFLFYGRFIAVERR